MIALRALGFSALLLLASSATASSFVATTDTLGGAVMGTSDATSDASSALRDDKIVLAARSDAASFVASQGAIRGVQLQAALDSIRRRVPAAQHASDQVLAEAILAR
jgi:uncharacterized protein (TIGR02448 family)